MDTPVSCQRTLQQMVPASLFPTKKDIITHHLPVSCNRNIKKCAQNQPSYILRA